MCATGINPGIDTRPAVFAQHRYQEWPQAGAEPWGVEGLQDIYQAVRQSGIPNAMGCRIPIPRALLDKWDAYAPEMGEYLLSLGFPSDI